MVLYARNCSCTVCVHCKVVLTAYTVSMPCCAARLPAVCDSGSHGVPEEGVLPHALHGCPWNQTVRALDCLHRLYYMCQGEYCGKGSGLVVFE